MDKEAKAIKKLTVPIKRYTRVGDKKDKEKAKRTANMK